MVSSAMKRNTFAPVKKRSTQYYCNIWAGHPEFVNYLLPELDAQADVWLLSPGVVTAEMFQSQEDSEVMSKMVEDLDEVGSEFPKSYLSLALYYVQCVCVV